MNEELAQATVNALARQRDNAMNGCAQLEAQLELLSAENKALKEQLAALQPVDVDSVGQPIKVDGQVRGNGHAQATSYRPAPPLTP